MNSKYKSEWKEFSMNKDFWNEVLLGRTIKDVVFNEEGIESIVFDNDEKLFVWTNENGKAVFCIDD